MTLMNDVFHEYPDVLVIVYLDDTLVYRKTLLDHKRHLCLVLEALRKHKRFGKKSKCHFAKSCVEFLGHKISSDGIAMEEQKIKAISDWPSPKSKVDVQSFLGLVNYYRRFLKIIGHVARQRPSHMANILLSLRLRVSSLSSGEKSKKMHSRP